MLFLIFDTRFLLRSESQAIPFQIPTKLDEPPIQNRTQNGLASSLVRTYSGVTY